MMQEEDRIKKMTLEEKASLCSGGDFWHTKALERLEFPAAMLSDGPNGLRMQEGKTDHLGINESVKAVCFPTASALAASFDTELVHEIGKTLGKECKCLGVSMLLGPGMNIKRSPLCGRNFEYYSEDPYLSGKMGAAFVKGVESENVGACVKHFAANNQETGRLTADSVIDERTLYEIYLSGFKEAVKEGKPSGVMCSYNRINGVYAAENKRLLTDILRKEWGFEGVVVTDWGAIKNRVTGLEAGVDLEMPGGDNSRNNDEKIAEAVRSGKIEEQLLDESVQRIMAFVKRTAENKREERKNWLEEDYQKALHAEKECAVLLKNEKELLPLDRKQKVAFIGEFVEKPRCQGSGSSHIASAKLPAVSELIKKESNISYAKGFLTDKDTADEKLEREAIELAESSDVAVIFAGLPNRFEAEGKDRNCLALPENQNMLITKISQVQKRTVVVLHNGAPVTMPWKEQVNSILEMYLGGDGVSEAAMSLLYGESNPCGKLAETFPVKLEDNPSYLNFPGENGVSEYREGIFVGYRYYEKKKQEVLFPFGHGLSYTQFRYDSMQMEEEGENGRRIRVSVTVENTGKCFGKEVVQLYVGQRDSQVRRPQKELKGFEKIALFPGEKKTVVFFLEENSFAYYETKIHDFYAPDGVYLISIGSSSADIRLTEEIIWKAKKPLPMEITMDTTIGEVLAHPQYGRVMQSILQGIYNNKAGSEADEANKASIESMGEGAESTEEKMVMEMTFRSIVTFGAMTEEQVEHMISILQESA